MSSFILLPSAVRITVIRCPRVLSMKYRNQSFSYPLAVDFEPHHKSNDDYLVEVFVDDKLVAREPRNGRNFQELAMGPFFRSADDDKPSPKTGRY